MFAKLGYRTRYILPCVNDSESNYSKTRVKQTLRKPVICINRVINLPLYIKFEQKPTPSNTNNSLNCIV